MLDLPRNDEFPVVGQSFSLVRVRGRSRGAGPIQGGMGVRRYLISFPNGGDSFYLCHWMRESGLADLLPSLETVWVGLSAGSMVMTPRIGEDFVIWTPPDGGDEALGLVEFSIFPHVENPYLPTNTMAAADRCAAG